MRDNFNKTRKKILSTQFEDGTSGGKLPPQATDLEEVVLGAMLLEKEAVEAVISILEPNSFYKEQNAIIFEAIVNLYKRSEPADILTVTKELARTNKLEIVGGTYYVSGLTVRVASSANIEFHARVIQEKQLARDLIKINNEGIINAYKDDTDVFDLFAKQSQLLDSCLDGIMKYESKSIGDAHTDLMIKHQDVRKSGRVSGVPTGFRQLDKFTGGWQKSDLVVVGARPGMGKSAFVVSCAKNAAVDFNKPTAIFSLEMSTEQLAARIQSNMSEIELSRVQKNQLSEEEERAVDFECKALYKAPLYIDDTPGLTLIELKTKARKLVAKFKVELIIIDYLQLMSGGDGGGNREQEISAISRGLKGLAKELDIPIIALSQLSRQVENRPGGSKRPQLSDLRESGAIEQDADMVLFCYRPAYYELETHIIENVEFPSAGLFDLIVAKNRHGGIGNVVLGWIGELTKLTNYDYVAMKPDWESKEEKKKKNENNFDNSKQTHTFVQPLNKMDENTDFLNQKGEQKPFNNDDIPF